MQGDAYGTVSARDEATARLRRLIERPHTRRLWGRDYPVTPRLIAAVFGDGSHLALITPVMTRPNYFVVRVGANTDVWEIIGDIQDAAEEEYGWHDGEDGHEDFPAVCWADGCSWSRPFPISEWEAA